MAQHNWDTSGGDESPGRASGSLRVGDAERTQAVDLLRQHLGAGRIDLGEFEERSGLAYQARIGDDLSVLLADLPPIRTSAMPGSWTAQPVNAAGPSRPAGAGWLGMAGRHRLLLLVAVVSIFAWANNGYGYPWWLWFVVPWAFLTFGRGGRRCGSARGRRSFGPGQQGDRWSGGLGDGGRPGSPTSL